MHDELVLVVAGSRHIDDAYAVVQHLGDWIKEHGSPDEVRHGGCRGVDKIAGEVLSQTSVPVFVYEAKWDEYGKAAGPRRNRAMANGATHLLLIWDGKSRGSANMRAQAESAGLHITEHIYA